MEDKSRPLKASNPIQRINTGPVLDPLRLVNPNKINSLLKMQEMLFIYNAVLDGWTVRRLDDDRYEFQKDLQKVTSDVCLDSYLREFVDYYLQAHAD